MLNMNMGVKCHVLIYLLFLGVLQISLARGKKQCHIIHGDEDEPILVNTNHMGNITAGDNLGGKCWQFTPPNGRNDMVVVLNVTHTNCSDKFKINKDEKHCSEDTPFVYTHIPEKCSARNCPSGDGNCVDKQTQNLEISFEKTKGDFSFSLKYEFIPCYLSTTPVQTTGQEPSTPESGIDFTVSIAQSSATTNSKARGTEEATTLKKDNENSTLPLTESPTSPTIASGSSQLLSIFIPIVIILLLAILFLLVVLKIRHKKLAVEQARKAGRHQAQTTNVTAEQGYEPIDSDKEQLPGIAFGNQAYQTVISNEDQTGSYAVIEDGAVYYSPVNGESGTNQQTGSGTPTTTTYDQVAGDETGIQSGGPPHSYEEVTLQVAQGNEKQEVDNILYGEN